MAQLSPIPKFFNTLVISVLLVQSLAYATNVTEPEDDFHRYIPPALPEHKWEKYRINYTELHEQYSSALTCVFVPFGVFGCFLRGVFIWLCFIDAFKFGILMDKLKKQKEKKEKAWGSLVSCASGFAWSVPFLISSYRTLTECSDEPGFAAIRNGIRMDFTVGLLGTVASGISMIATLPKCYPILAVSIFLTIVAFLVQCIQHAVLLFDITRAAGVTRDLIIHERFRVNQRAYLVACIIDEILMLPLTVIGLGVLNVFGATGNVFLGNIIGDPWGSYYVSQGWGKAMAVIASLGIFWEIGMAGLGYGIDHLLHKGS